MLEKFSILQEKGKELTSTNHLLLSRQYEHSSVLAIHRGKLQASLLSSLGGLKIHTGKHCQGIEQQKEFAEVRFSDGTTARADLVFGCDGIHSAVRQALFPPVSTRFAGYTCWRGIAEKRPANMHVRSASESWGRGQRFGLVPLKDDKAYWFAGQNTIQIKDPAFSRKGIDDLKKLFASFHALVQEVLENTPPDAVLLNDILDYAPFLLIQKAG